MQFCIHTASAGTCCPVSEWGSCCIATGCSSSQQDSSSRAVPLFVYFLAQRSPKQQIFTGFRESRATFSSFFGTTVPKTTDFERFRGPSCHFLAISWHGSRIILLSARMTAEAAMRTTHRATGTATLATSLIKVSETVCQRKYYIAPQSIVAGFKVIVGRVRDRKIL